MRRRDFIACAAAGRMFAQAQSKRTTAERIGYSPDTKLLMVHADDVGMCHSVNAATTEALLSGAVQSASIMVPCPWLREIAEAVRERPELDIGLHLTLTSEWQHYRWGPVAPVDRIPGLIDPDGYLWRDVRGVATHASAAEVELELRAQIERARRVGIRFTHLDTHMGTLYARRDYFEVYTKLAREARVPCMMPRPAGVAAAQLKGYPITAEMLERKEAEGFVMLDRLVTGVQGSTPEERKQSYEQFLRQLTPGVTKLIVHLAKDDPEIRAVTNSWRQRYGDYLFWTSEMARALVKELDIRPVTYRELANLAYTQTERE
ncbi:MAG TPA: polysaccharide deacetylase family protein [Bryobacteraceae bacterium]|nr:polysaccharide deacetylase family protein [Bryobacteraceae bacterium]